MLSLHLRPSSAARFENIKLHHPFYDRIMCRSSSAITCQPKKAQAPSTPRRRHGIEDFDVGKRYGLDGRSIRSARTASICRIPKSLPANISGKRIAAIVDLLRDRGVLLPPKRSRTAIRIAGAIARQSFSARRRSGSSAWRRKACAKVR